MPREPRTKSSTGIYHVMIRGINRQIIFEDDEDKSRLFKTLSRYKNISNYKLYGYCFMDNHIHLLIREVDESISDTIKRISSSYVYWYNTKYDRHGHLFQDRFKSETVENPHYFKKVLRYIHQNPLKARLSQNVFDYKWTSLNEYLGQARIVDANFALQLFSTDRNKALQHFLDYMQENNDDECLDDYIKVRTSDSNLRNYIKQLGIPNGSLLQQMERKQRNEIISHLKQIEGVSIRQLARITGISKSVIQRVK